MENKLIILKSDVEKWNNIVSKYVPYDIDDPVLKQLDGEYDSNRLAATNAKAYLAEIEAHPEKYLIQ